MTDAGAVAEKKRYRVAQFATGNVGSRSLRHIINHPDMELTGVWVHSASKTGKDAGELAGTGPTGVKATNSLDDLLAAKPDCVMYMPHVFRIEEVVQILESGSNIVSTRMELQNPAALDDPTIATRIEEACRKGNTSVHASGSSPGFISEAFPVVLASIQRRFDHLLIDEFADNTTRDSPEMIFEMMGFGQKPDTAMMEGQLHHLKMSFGPTFKLLAAALGKSIDRFEAIGAQGIAREDVKIAAGVVPKGTVAATRSTIIGYHGDTPLMTFRANWFVSTDIDTSDGEVWDLRKESGWRVIVEGDCPMRLDITFPVAEEDYAEMTPGLTANRPINAVPYVCDAPAGIVTTFDLPQIIARLG